MLTAPDNELLTRTGAGAAMGEYFRRFWQPVALSRELPEPDGAPIRVKVLGEELVAFRDTGGRIGLIEPQCAHRRRGSRSIPEHAYWITSSARTSTDPGILRPSTLAVRRLTTKPHFVDSSIGRSLDFAPRRIRSTKEAARLKFDPMSGP